jgi:Spy/CpxP family protein refolding chaperone
VVKGGKHAGTVGRKLLVQQSMFFLLRALRFACLVGLASLTFWSSVSAQGFKWWQNDRYRAELGLTADQSKRLEEIFQSTLPTMRAQKKAFDEAESEFARLVNAGNDSAATAQIQVVETARAEMNKTRALMLLRMRRALTTDQWVKFGALHQADERERKSQSHGSQPNQGTQGK